MLKISSNKIHSIPIYNHREHFLIKLKNQSNIIKVAIVDDRIYANYQKSFEEIKNYLLRLGFDTVINNTIFKQIETIESITKLVNKKAFYLDKKIKKPFVISDNNIDKLIINDLLDNIDVEMLKKIDIDSIASKLIREYFTSSNVYLVSIKLHKMDTMFYKNEDYKIIGIDDFIWFGELYQNVNDETETKKLSNDTFNDLLYLKETTYKEEETFPYISYLQTLFEVMEFKNNKFFLPSNLLGHNNYDEIKLKTKNYTFNILCIYDLLAFEVFSDLNQFDIIICEPFKKKYLLPKDYLFDINVNNIYKKYLEYPRKIES